jgi:O-antigen/teichoic acid export membrane protein
MMRELVKAVLKTGSGSGGSLLLGVITMKVMPVVLGPSGVGLYSPLRQTMTSTISLGNLGGAAALVQGLASFNGQARDTYLVTTIWSS